MQLHKFAIMDRPAAGFSILFEIRIQFGH